LAGRWVFCPVSPKSFRYGNSPLLLYYHAYSANNSRFYFRHLRFRCIGFVPYCAFSMFPPSLLYMIPAFGTRVESINCVGNTNVHHSSLFHVRTLKQEVPEGSFLLCYMDRLRPGFTIVCAFSQY
jgi:hypothetical protein